MTAEVEKFMGAGRTLADRDSLPTGKGQWQKQYNASQVSRIVLGQMLGYVGIVPMPVAQCSVIGYDGDPEMLRALTARIDGRSLVLEGQIPFKEGSAGRNFGSGGVFFDGDVTIVNGSFTSFSTTSSGPGGTTMIINNREVDLDRLIRVVLVVPETTDVKVTDLIGVTGITDRLDAAVDFSPAYRSELHARNTVRSLTGDISGSGSASVGGVTEDAELEISGSGSFQAGAVEGTIDAKVSGSGRIIVGGGTSRRLRASVSGSGHVQHNGTVSGDARLRVSGSGSVTAARVQGEVDPKVTGSGLITVNGQTYRPRHQGGSVTINRSYGRHW